MGSPHVERIELRPAAMIPVNMLGLAGDDSEEERVGGAKSSPSPTAVRRRATSTEPLELSSMDVLELAIRFSAFWEGADEVEHRVGTASCGRRRGIGVAEVLLVELATHEFRSYRNAVRQLTDRHLWKRLRDVVAYSFPDRPSWRLSSVPPSRHQHRRLRQRIIDDGLTDLLAERLEIVAAAVSRHLGMFDESNGSTTHPAPQNFLIGDGTWLPAAYKIVDRPDVDRRTDPDAYPFHDRLVGAGHMLVLATSKNGHPHESVLHSVGFKPHKGKNDAAVFAEMVAAAQPRLPGMQGVVYDMALYPALIDDFMQRGIIAVSKVAHTQGGKLAYSNLGEHEFKSKGRESKTVVVHAVDGSPAVQVTVKSESMVVLLERVQLKSRRRVRGGVTWYGHWRIPDVPGVPPSWRGLTTLIRMSTNQDEAAAGRSRSRALRLIPPSDPDFGQLYGYRQFAESTNHHLKSSLFNGRARCVGQQRIRLNLLGYQLRGLVIALEQHRRRTGRSVDHWFGPPPDIPAAA